MSRACQVCGGLIFASNEVASYSGPICNGMHLQSLPTNNFDYFAERRIAELERRVAELTSQMKSLTKNAPTSGVEKGGDLSG